MKKYRINRLLPTQVQNKIPQLKPTLKIKQRYFSLKQVKTQSKSKLNEFQINNIFNEEKWNSTSKSNLSQNRKTIAFKHKGTIVYSEIQNTAQLKKTQNLINAREKWKIELRKRDLGKTLDQFAKIK